jgi:hypothetical protein
MSRIEGLLKAYEEFVAQPWVPHLSGAESVWFAVYDPPQERRLLLRIPEFANATIGAGHGWRHVDLASTFAGWMGGHRYRESYFADPDALDLALTDFRRAVIAQVKIALDAPGAHAQAVVALPGAGSLFGLIKISDVLDQVTSSIRGRLLLFFPGRYENAPYRFMPRRLLLPDSAQTWPHLRS